MLSIVSTDNCVVGVVKIDSYFSICADGKQNDDKTKKPGREG